MCTFLFIVLPTLALRGLYRGCCWLYTYVTGKKTTQPKERKAEPQPQETTKKPVQSGFCPYTFVMDLFGIDYKSKKRVQVSKAKDEQASLAQSL